AAGTAPTSSRSKPAEASARPRSTASSAVELRAPSKNESGLALTIPAARGGGNSSSRSASRQAVIAAYVSGRERGRSPGGPGACTVPPVPLRCAYTDLDGTLL